MEEYLVSVYDTPATLNIGLNEMARNGWSIRNMMQVYDATWRITYTTVVYIRWGGDVK